MTASTIAPAPPLLATGMVTVVSDSSKNIVVVYAFELVFLSSDMVVERVVDRPKFKFISAHLLLP